MAISLQWLRSERWFIHILLHTLFCHCKAKESCHVFHLDCCPSVTSCDILQLDLVAGGGLRKIKIKGFHDMVNSFRLTFYNAQIGLNYSMSVHGQRVEQESSFARAAVTATEPNPCGDWSRSVRTTSASDTTTLVTLT
eukprot:3900353-Rhodomonas_salina.1